MEHVCDCTWSTIIHSNTIPSPASGRGKCSGQAMVARTHSPNAFFGECVRER
jgi:hypothetical protein